MPNVFFLIGESWDFFRKQPAYNHVLLWLIILPYALMNILATLLQWSQEGVMFPFTATEQGTLAFLMIMGMLALTVVMIWGSACVLLVGSRLIRNRAGRSRTSFRAVRHDARSLIVPLLFTGILRGCFTVFWSLLLIIPGIIYSIRTAFYHVVVVTERIQYREALRRCQEVVRGQTWQVFWMLLGLGLVLFLPINLLTLRAYAVMEEFDWRLTIVVDVMDAAMNGFSTVLYLLSSILLYDALRKNARLPAESSSSP